MAKEPKDTGNARAARSAKAEEAPADPFKRFLVDLAANPTALAAFTTDPDGAMAAAGLSAADRAILTSGNAAAIYARFQGSAVAAAAPEALAEAVADGGQTSPDGATAARLALQLTVQPILPQVTVNPILPQVTVNPILPPVTVNPTFPPVTVNPTFPPVTVNPTFPPVTINPDFPPVTINPIFPQVTVTPTFPQLAHTDPPPVTVQTVLPYPQTYPYPYSYPQAGPWGSYPPPSQGRCCCCCRCRGCGC